ncbi:MAG: hypothetical protein ACOCQ2_03260 [Halanaerobiales bacterium]
MENKIKTIFTQKGPYKLTISEEKYEVFASGTLLFGSKEKTSCTQLARIALNHHSQPEIVLIGGLGMGFTLQEVLTEDTIQEIDVIEIEPEVVEWNKKFFAQQNDKAVNDSRVKIFITDIINYLSQFSSPKFDIIILDIDNGPTNVIHPDNSYLYSKEMLKITAELLRPRGLLAIWSVTREKWFLKRLNKIFKEVQEKTILTPHKKSGSDYVYLAFR